jgi:hypothetical protein
VMLRFIFLLEKILVERISECKLKGIEGFVRGFGDESQKFVEDLEFDLCGI